MFGELVAGAAVVGMGCSTHVGGANGVLGVVVAVEGTVDTEGNIDVDNVVEVDTVEEVFENHPQIG